MRIYSLEFPGATFFHFIFSCAYRVVGKTIGSMSLTHGSDNVEVDSDDDSYIPRSNIMKNKSLLKRFLFICTARQIMVLGDHWEFFGKFRLNLGTALPTQMSTWYPKYYVPFFMLGLANGEVAFYIHETKQMYMASCSIEMPKLPEGTLLCLNYTEDITHDKNGTSVIKSPQMLLYDVVMVQGNKVCAPAEERYLMVRDIYLNYISGSEQLEKLFHLQWVGHNTHATAFTDGTFNLKHEVGGIMALTQNPLLPIRTIRVSIPMHIYDPSTILDQLQFGERELVRMRSYASSVPATGAASASPATLATPTSHMTPPVTLNTTVEHDIFKEVEMNMVESVISGNELVVEDEVVMEKFKQCTLSTWLPLAVQNQPPLPPIGRKRQRKKSVCDELAVGMQMIHKWLIPK